MITKVITCNCTYKLKIKNKQLELNDACEQLKATIKNKLNAELFDEYMHIITKETTITTERVEQQEVEFIVMLFTTLEDDVLPNRTFRKYMEEHLLKIDTNDLTARVIKRRIY